MAEARAVAAAGECDELATLSGEIFQLDPKFHVEVFRVDPTVSSCTRIRDEKLARAHAPDPSTLPSPEVATLLSVGTTLVGIGLFTAGVMADGDTAQLSLLGTGFVLAAVGPWTGRRYGNAVTSPWRNVRLVGLAASAVGLITLPACLGDDGGSDTGCGISGGLVGLGGIIWAVGTFGELANTAGDVRKAQGIRVTPTIAPTTGGAALGVSGTF